MSAAGNGHRFTTGSLVAGGLGLLAIGGLIVGAICRELKFAPSGADTPVVIMGGSVNFKAKNSGWTPCVGGDPSANTTCYVATFNLSDKKTLKNYQFVTEDGLVNNPVTTATSVTNGWEVDVADGNPSNTSSSMQYGVLVCAESSRPFTSCSSNAIASDSIYVILKGSGGFFDIPHSRKLVYHDANAQYDFISNIALNATNATGGTSEPCTESRCFLLLSSQ